MNATEQSDNEMVTTGKGLVELSQRIVHEASSGSAYDLCGGQLKITAIGTESGSNGVRPAIIADLALDRHNGLPPLKWSFAFRLGESITKAFDQAIARLPKLGLRLRYIDW